jgi:Uma2 family endonuclease
MTKVMTKRGRLSYSAYSQTPADGKRYEFLGGEVYVSPPPSFSHQHTLVELLVQLRDYFIAPDIGARVYCAPLAVILSDTPPWDAEIVEPDLIVVNDFSMIEQRGLNGAPHVTIEIVSPSNPSLDRKVKFERYAANDVLHYWIVEPIKETMECYRLVDGRYVLDAMGTGGELLSIPAFPGLTVDLGKIWLRLNPAGPDR